MWNCGITLNLKGCCYRYLKIYLDAEQVFSDAIAIEKDD
jgi:hypothetical protein